MSRSYNSSASVELFYDAQAQVAGSPFYERRANQLLWVDSKQKKINFLSLDTKKNRFIVTIFDLISITLTAPLLGAL